MVLRADKAARAARHNFDTWYSQKVSECPQYRFSFVNSPLSLLRSSCPHSLLYFLIQVLHLLLHQFWPIAHLDSYVKQCRKANGRCPPSIIALLFYYECSELRPSRSVALPAAIKREFYDSESDEIAATDAPPAKRGRASSGVPNVVAGLTAETPATSAVSCESKFEGARMQQDFARRFAYIELDQHSRAALAYADMRRAARPRVCMQIYQAFEMYQTTNEFSREPLDPVAVVAELRFTVGYFSQMKLWPAWALQPNNLVVRSLPEVDTAHEDFDNEYWEAVVNLMNLSSVMPSLYVQGTFNAAANTMYGDRVNKSGVGSYKFRVNIVERLLTHLLERRVEEVLALDHCETEM